MKTLNFSSDRQEITTVAEKLKRCKRWVFVVGAGISVSSGIPVITTVKELYRTFAQLEDFMKPREKDLMQSPKMEKTCLMPVFLEARKVKKRFLNL
jgi:NAD-dependent SIR2 family protein deacetylase